MSLIAVTAVIVASVLLAYETWSVIVTCGESCNYPRPLRTWLYNEHAWQWYADYAIGAAGWLTTLVAAWSLRGNSNRNFASRLLLAALLFSVAYAWPMLASGR
jgi:hypothetical protein